MTVYFVGLTKAILILMCGLKTFTACMTPLISNTIVNIVVLELPIAPITKISHSPAMQVHSI